MSRRGDVYELFNHANPALPATTFQPRDSDALVLLERYLAAHQIRMLNDPSPVFLAVKIGVFLGFVCNVGFSLWLRFYLSFSFITVVLISFGIGIVLSVLLNKF